MRINEGSGELIMIDIRLFLAGRVGAITGQLRFKISRSAVPFGNPCVGASFHNI